MLEGQTESTAVPTAPTAPTAPPVETDEGAKWREKIVHSDDPDPDDELQPDAQVAPDTGHPTEPKAPDAPASGTPTDDAGAVGEVADASTIDTATQGDDAVKAEPVDEDAAMFDELLGLKETEPADPLVWKERHSEATRALHEARDQMKQVAEVLRQQGREIVTTKDGFGIAPTDDAKDFDPSTINLAAIMKELTQDDLDSLADNPAEGAKVIAKRIAQEFAARVPPITARPQDAILSAHESQVTWNEFVGVKMNNGRPLYPDATTPEVMAEMEKAYTALPPELQERSERDKSVLRAVQELCYLRVYRARQTRVALVKARAAKVAEQNQKNQKGVAVSGSGSETGTKAQASAGVPDVNNPEWWRQQIVSAGKDSVPEN